jgi:hypothetical protein
MDYLNMDYLTFRAKYIGLLHDLIDNAEDHAQRETIDLCNQLADMEECHPAWAERVEDYLADRRLYQT